MKQWAIDYSALAKADILSIGHYLSKVLQTPRAARAQVSRIVAQISELQTLPKKFPAYDTDACGKLGLQRMNVDKFAVFYLLDDTASIVTIIRVLYGGRDIDHILEDATEA